jgi:uncharacterized surface protein with fasciclin (FAS1) repeats
VRASLLVALAADVLDMPRLLRGGGPSTLLVPSDAAFERFPKQVLHELLSVGREPRLAEFLRSHLVTGRHPLAGGEIRMRTRAGRDLALRSTADGSACLNDHLPIVKTTEASGHVLHVIDGVLWDA